MIWHVAAADLMPHVLLTTPKRPSTPLNPTLCKLAEVQQIPVSSAGPRPTPSDPQGIANGISSPFEPHSAYRGSDWTPERLMFHQNLESFAERVGLVVGLQSNGKMSQEQAYDEIRRIWNDLKESKNILLNLPEQG